MPFIPGINGRSADFAIPFNSPSSVCAQGAPVVHFHKSIIYSTSCSVANEVANGAAVRL